MGGRGSEFNQTARGELTYKESMVVTKYFSSESYKINEKIYLKMELDSYERDFIYNMDNALKKMPFVKGKDLVRDLSFPFKEQKEKFISQINVGNILINEAYWSATKDTEYQEVPDVRFIIKNSRKARDMESVEGKGENEVIFERETKFKIISKNVVKKYGEYDILEVELREIK